MKTRGEVRSFCRRELVKDYLVYPDGTAKELETGKMYDWKTLTQELRKADFREV